MAVNGQLSAVETTAHRDAQHLIMPLLP